MSDFYDDSIRLMEELLVSLEQEAKAQKVGAIVIEENAEDVLFRLLGVTVQEEEKLQTFINNYFKIKKGTVSQELKEFNRLLRVYRSRLSGYNKAKTKIKLNRLKKILTEGKLDRDKLVKQTPEDTRREVERQFKKIKEEGNLTGLVQNTIEGNEAIVEVVDRVVEKIPTEISKMKNLFLTTLRTQSKDSIIRIEQLNNYKEDLEKEVQHLENFDKLLFEGQLTFDGKTKLSLSKVLDVLIFLTDRQRMRYDCSQCKYYLQNKNSVCTFAGDGKNALTSTVTITNPQGEEVTGKLTKGNYSCKEVWGLDENDYFLSAESVREFIKKLLRG